MFNGQNVTTSGGGATLSYVGGSSAGCASSPCYVAYSPTAGNDVIVDVTIQDNGSAGTTSVLDSSSSSCTTGISTYTYRIQTTGGAVAGNFDMIEAETLSVGSGVSYICVTSTTSPALIGFTVRQYHRTSGSWATDQVSTQASGTGTSQTAGSITTSASPVVVSGILWQATDGTTTFTGTSPYTVREQVAIPSSGSLVASGDQISTSSGTFAFAATTSGSVTWYGYTTSSK